MSGKMNWAWFLTFWMALVLLLASISGLRTKTPSSLIIGWIVFVILWIVYGIAWAKYKQLKIPKKSEPEFRPPVTIRIEPGKIPETVAELLEAEEEEDEFEEDFLITEITEDEDEPI